MKNITNYFKPMLALALAAVLFSCNNAGTKKEEAAAFTPYKMMTIKHTVADYDKFLAVYNSKDSLRAAYGLTKSGIGRGMEDANTVMIFEKMDDLQKAKDFGASPALKDAMMQAGVNSAPEASFATVIRDDNSKIDQKARMMVAHHVKDFAAWLKVYDGEGKDKRMSEGMMDRGMARGLEDTNMVYLVFAVKDMEKVKTAMASEDKKKLMTDAGVDSQPTVFFYNLEMQ